MGFVMLVMSSQLSTKILILIPEGSVLIVKLVQLIRVSLRRVDPLLKAVDVFDS